MNNRSWQCQALILSLSEFGEGHRNVRLLVPQEQDGCALVFAAVFGGARSKLRGMVSPFQTGQVWIYSNPIKNSHKITDFSVSSYRIELRDSLVRMWLAAACSEIVLKMHGIVNWQVVNAFLDGLCISDDESCKKAFLRFLWRVLQFSGIAPDVTECCKCRCRIIPMKQQSEVLGYTPYEEGFYCSECTRGIYTAYTLHTEAFNYLYAVTETAPGYSRSLPLSSRAYGELKQLLFFLVERQIGSKLNSFQTGNAIF